MLSKANQLWGLNYKLFKLESYLFIMVYIWVGCFKYGISSCFAT